MIHECGNRVPILSGKTFSSNYHDLQAFYVGFSCQQDVASLVAINLGAQELQLWKSTDGLYTANPKDVKSARLIPIISPEEAAELSKIVIHPSMMSQMMRANIPIRIKNAEKQSPGTLILPEKQQASNLGYATPPLTPEHGCIALNCPTAVSVKRNLHLLHVHSNRKLGSHEFLAALFSTLDRHDVPVDLNSTSETHVCMTLPSHNSLDKALLSDLEKLGKVKKL